MQVTSQGEGWLGIIIIMVVCLQYRRGFDREDLEAIPKSYRLCKNRCRDIRTAVTYPIAVVRCRHINNPRHGDQMAGVKICYGI